MKQQLLAQLGAGSVGVGAIVVGVVWIFGAFTTRRRRATFPSTYRRQGGGLYTVFELGCAGVIILAGLMMVALVLLAGRAIR
jgi:hypothetical protein